jgi:hypothetical protein
MKQKNILLLTIGLFLLQLQTSLVAQGYVPFPDSGGVWQETYWWQPSPFFYNGIGGTYIDGYTVFNDTTYKKIYNLRRDVFCSDVIIEGPEYYGALREDSINQKVYFVGNPDSGEWLFYDYNLHIGDTLPFEISPFYSVFITDIDTITTFDGVTRRIWYLDYEEPFDGWPQIIEGIGLTSGLLGSIEPYWEGWNELLCFSINGDEVWRSWKDTCYVFTDSCATVGINESVQMESVIRCYPNPLPPSTNFAIEINPLHTSSNSISLFDLCGREVFFKTFHENSITIKSPANKGIYVLKIFANENYSTFKIIVSN